MQTLRSWLRGTQGPEHSAARRHSVQLGTDGAHNEIPQSGGDDSQHVPCDEHSLIEISSAASLQRGSLVVAKRPADDAEHGGDKSRPAKRHKKRDESILGTADATLNTHVGRASEPTPASTKRPRDVAYIDESVLPKRRKDTPDQYKALERDRTDRDPQNNQPRHSRVRRVLDSNDDSTRMQRQVLGFKASSKLRSKAEQYVKATNSQARRCSNERMLGVGSWPGSNRIPGSAQHSSRADKIELPIRKPRKIA